jgi:hypothetical protein
MTGAAAESILLATAIKKVGNEQTVLSEYRSATGRGRVIKRVTGGAAHVLASRFELALGILSYWRDDAAHGNATAIGEIEAHEALSRLLRLAQFASDNWITLTT